MTYKLILIIGVLISTVLPNHDSLNSIIEVNGIKINLDTIKSNVTIKLKEYGKKEFRHGADLYVKYTENAILSENRNILFIGKEEDECAEYVCVPKYKAEIYDLINNKLLIGKIIFENGYYISGNFINNEYLLFRLTDENAARISLDIYTINGKKKYHEEFSGKLKYYVLPDSKRIIIIDEQNEINEEDGLTIRYSNAILFNISNMKVKQILKIRGKEDLDTYKYMFSTKDNSFIIEYIEDSKITAFYFTNDNLKWQKTYDFLKPTTFFFTNNSEAILYSNKLIDINSGNILKDSLTKEEIKTYQINFKN